MKIRPEGLDDLKPVDKQSLSVYRDVHAAMHTTSTTPPLWSALEEIRLDYDLPELSEYGRDTRCLLAFHQLLITPDLAPKRLVVFNGPAIHQPQEVRTRQFHLPSAPRIVIQNISAIMHTEIPDACSDLELQLARQCSSVWKDAFSLTSMRSRGIHSILWGSISTGRSFKDRPIAVRRLKVMGVWDGEAGWRRDEVFKDMLRDLKHHIFYYQHQPRREEGEDPLQLCVMGDWDERKGLEKWESYTLDSSSIGDDESSDDDDSSGELV
jgi:hypothetical protein